MTSLANVNEEQRKAAEMRRRKVTEAARHTYTAGRIIEKGRILYHRDGQWHIRQKWGSSYPKSMTNASSRPNRFMLSQ